jgi:carbonic anhydrase
MTAILSNPKICKMKNLMVASVAFLFLSCHQTEQKNSEKEATVQKPIDSAQVGGDNFVKSEAPDAGTKMDQGYCLSRHNNGMAQSPINILTFDADKVKSRNVPIRFNTQIVAVENLGHTIQVDFAGGSECQADGKIYTSKQFHFHTPSEHMIDGMTFPMEMHIVNVLKDSNIKNKPSFLVVGILFKMGKENKLLNEFLKDVPKEESEKDSLPPGTVNMNDLSPLVLNSSAGNSFYSYDGSLTTAPFTESVHWVILKQIVEASPDQIIAIEKMEGNNARHIQEIYDRKVASAQLQPE